MDGFDIAAFVVMAILAGMAIGVFIFLGDWPGRVARRLDLPYVEVISIGGWITLIFRGVGFPFILVWVYALPVWSSRLLCNWRFPKVSKYLSFLRVHTEQLPCTSQICHLWVN